MRTGPAGFNALRERAEEEEEEEEVVPRYWLWLAAMSIGVEQLPNEGTGFLADSPPVL